MRRFKNLLLAYRWRLWLWRTGLAGWHLLEIRRYPDGAEKHVFRYSWQ